MNYQETDYRKAIELVEDSYDKMFTPPPDLTMSQWADEHLYLSPEDSAEPGKYQVDRAPYQRGMLDAVSDPSIKEIVYCTSSQIGKTLMAKAILGYYISQDPGPILVMQPTVGVAETFSKDRLAPMIRDTPILTGLIADPKSRNSGNTIDKKALSVTTPIATPDGWRLMGDLSIGDYVFGDDGNPTQIIDTSEVFTNRKCYNVKFTDGEAIIADAGHLWGVYVWKVDKSEGKPKQVREYKVLETREMLSYENNGRLKFSIKNAQPLSLPEAHLPIDPYILGAWLGDGYKHRAVICGGLFDMEMAELLKAAGADQLRTTIQDNRLALYYLDPIPGDSVLCPNGHDRAVYGALIGRDGKRKCKRCHADRQNAVRGAGNKPKPIANTFLKKLRDLGVTSKIKEYSNKHIPKTYLRASFDQRLSLLQGLMDTDGHVVPKSGRCIFSASYERLATGFMELLSSLGIKYTHAKVKPAKGQIAYRIEFQSALPVFRLTRKANDFANSRPNPENQAYKQIKSITECESVPVKCITVDNQSKLFLAGVRMTPTHNSFPGGHITMIGANAPTELASRPIRIVFADEVDRYPTSAGSEGDPIFLARQRSVTFWNRKMIMASTPTIAGASRIWKAFENSDQRYYYLPCPHCSEFHTLKWAQMVWDEGEASTAMMACPVCGGMYGDADKLRMLAHGEWRAANPKSTIAGFHISALYSPWQTFADVVSEWLLKKDNPETLKTFINLQLGECWEDRSGESVKADSLLTRRETWDSVPADVVIITAGVDVQDDRLEISVIGWTGEEQSRVLHHNKLYGSPGEPAVWSQLDVFLKADHFTADGRILRIKATAIDSGGHHTQQAYEFCRSRMGQRVVPIKGRKGAYPIWPTKSSKTKLSRGVSLFLVGVDTARDSLRSALAVRDPNLPRYVAFSAELTEDYFKQLTNEKRVMAYSKTGTPSRVWKKIPGARYEALDCYVYGIAALEYLKQSGMRLKSLARVIPAARVEKTVVEQPVVQKPVQVRPKQRTSSAIQ
jgi:phage terminase large subunit GpA-like protein